MSEPSTLAGNRQRWSRGTEAGMSFGWGVVGFLRGTAVGPRGRKQELRGAVRGVAEAEGPASRGLLNRTDLPGTTGKGGELHDFVTASGFFLILLGLQSLCFRVTRVQFDRVVEFLNTVGDSIVIFILTNPFPADCSVLVTTGLEAEYLSSALGSVSGSTSVWAVCEERRSGHSRD